MPVSTASPGITFGASPACRLPIVTTAGCERVDPARDDVLQAADELRRARDRVDGGVREPGVPAAAGDRQREEVGRGHERPGHGGDLAVLQRRPQVAAVDEVDALHHARGDHVARAAGSELLGVLEDEPQLAAGQVARRPAARRAEQHRGVAVVPARVHRARAARRRTRRRSPRGSAARRCPPAARPSARACRCSAARGRWSRSAARPPAPKPSSVSATNADVSCSSKADLGMAVQMAPPGHHVFVDPTHEHRYLPGQGRA